MLAKVIHTNDSEGSETIQINGHRIQFGGMGDGFCYTHQSFSCLENLTEAERKALQDAN